jgi:hypothetical protein
MGKVALMIFGPTPGQASPLQRKDAAAFISERSRDQHSA